MCADLECVLAALGAIRAPRTSTEYDLHALVAGALDSAGIAYAHEAPTGPGRRIDFLCGGVGVEVKRGRPPAAPLMRQLTAYAASGRVQALILVAERVPPLPPRAGGKPLRALSLQKLWGIAL